MARGVVPAALRAAAELEHRRRLAERLTMPKDVIVPHGMTFVDWCQQLADDGLKVDGRPFRLDNRPALLPVYQKIPSTLEQAVRRLLVIQKAAQLGLTIWEVLADIYLALKFAPITIGMFMPDQATAAYKSQHRFMRLVRTMPKVYRYMTVQPDRDTGKEQRVGEGNVLTRTLGESIFLFLWTSGKVSTESRPMDVVSLDEVQGMTLEQIDKVSERMSGSLIKYWMMLSTANMPDCDINFWYGLGTQEVWHSRCDACGAQSDLSDPVANFPKCIELNDRGQYYRAPRGEYIWVCPQCRAWIEDPQHGSYIELQPGAPHESMLLPQTISPTITPGEFIRGWHRAVTGDQKKTFYNRKLARPYIDASQLPVTMAHCLACVTEGERFRLKWETSGADTYMGIDQMGGFNAVLIKKRLPDGRQALVHAEAVFDEDPFRRCGEMMEQYGVAVCVVEQLPNVNDARRFANRFPGRVFLASYAQLKDDFLIWGDALSESDMRTDESERTRRTVTLQQYKCMQVALHRIRHQLCLFPKPEELEQEVIERGERKRIVLLRDWVFLHFTKTALVVEDDEEERLPKAKVLKVGIDPHFAFSNMLCDVAWARAHGTSTFFIPTVGPAAMSKVQKDVADSMPGLPTSVIAMMEVRDGTCGACEAFDGEKSRCRERDLGVGANDVACPIYVQRREPESS